MLGEPVRSALVAHLRREEGCVLHAYQDHLGYWTIGVGRLIDRRRGGGIDAAEADYLLGRDLERRAAELDGRLPWWRGQPEEVRVALLALAFQLGVGGLLGFSRTLAALQAGERARAAVEALDSAWARQTPARARRVAGMLRGR